MELNREQLRKIDKYIGEQVMGWKHIRYDGLFFTTTDNNRRIITFHPTTRRLDALDALNMLYDWGYSWSIKNETGLPYRKGSEGITVYFGQSSATHDDLCIAICLAILNALQVDVEGIIND